jgi:tetratricopeptide (TPR) repeat protein
MNRASWIGAAAGSIMVFNYRYNLLKKAMVFLNTRARKAGALISVILIIGFSGFGLYYLKKGSSTGRLLIWEVTAGKIIEKPLFGHGVGRFEAEYNNWQADYFKQHSGEMDGPKGMAAGNTRYCFNEYLEIASETGITGLILFLGLLASVFLSVKKAQNPKVNKEFKNEKITEYHQNYEAAHYSVIPSLDNYLTFSLIALLIMATISYPFYSLSTLILLFIFLGQISARTEPVSKNHLPVKAEKLFSTTLALLFIGSSIYLLAFTKRQYKSLFVMYESVMLYQAGIYDESSASFSEVYGEMKYNGPCLQYYAKALLMEEQYDESIKMYESAMQYTSDEMLYCSLGDGYKKLRRYLEAEDAYRHASYMTPHKLYPLYLLAVL